MLANGSEATGALHRGRSCTGIHTDNENKQSMHRHDKAAHATGASSSCGPAGAAGASE